MQGWRVFLCSIVSVTLASCASFTNPSYVTVRHTGGGYWDDYLIFLTFATSEGFQVFEQADLGRGATGGKTTGKVEMPTSGVVHVSFRVESKNGVIVSAGLFDLPLRSDWQNTVELNPAPAKGNYWEAGGCDSCLGSKAFPVHPEHQLDGRVEFMWVVWGGNSIKNPVIY